VAPVLELAEQTALSRPIGEHVDLLSTRVSSGAVNPAGKLTSILAPRMGVLSWPADARAGLLLALPHSQRAHRGSRDKGGRRPWQSDRKHCRSGSATRHLRRHRPGLFPLGRNLAFYGVDLRLSARHRKCLVVEFHAAPQSARVVSQDSAAFVSLSRRLFGRMSGQFCSM
jgi:hypothetical protein